MQDAMHIQGSCRLNWAAKHICADRKFMVSRVGSKNADEPEHAN